MSEFKPARFSRSNSDFSKELKKRVRAYFEENNISKYGNANMVVKTIFMLSLYFVPYGFIMSGIIESDLIFLLMWVLMGLGMAGIGLSIMHDANHSSYSKKQEVNNIISYVLNLVGGNSINWKIQHNVLHHTYTNVEGMDEDIEIGGLMRFSPHQKHLKHQKFQHIYAWFLYGFLSLSWVTVKEFVQLAGFNQKGLTKQFGKSFSYLLTELISWKVFYYIYILVLPFIFLDQSWWLVLLGFFLLHFVCGFILSCIFQSAHVLTETEYPLPDENGVMENNLLVHQLHTTSNFATQSRWFSWLIGGLNFQVEHHLFPNICHVHYRKLSKIVQETAEEFGMPYHNEKTFASALIKHGKMLHRLGQGTS